jgi:hypothetical protein
MREQIVFSRGGYPIGNREPDRSYWAIKLNDGTWLCEFDPVGLNSTLDWTLDIAGTNDWAKITELWMICPTTPLSPTGNAARLPISPAGTAFQLKVGMVFSNIGESVKSCKAQIIGRVVDFETGAAECFVFDYTVPGLIANWKTHIGLPGHPTMGLWRPNLPDEPSFAPIGRLSLPVLGIHLPTLARGYADG